MEKFRYIDDVDDWLEPMNYEEFWRVIKTHYLVLQPRESCDQQIADGEVDRETVLEVMKYLARIELTKRHGLHWKPATPWLKLVENH
jgi:hypothetical protein